MALQVLWLISSKLPYNALHWACRLLSSLSHGGQIKVSGTALGTVATLEVCCTPVPPSWGRSRELCAISQLRQVMLATAGRAVSLFFLASLNVRSRLVPSGLQTRWDRNQSPGQPLQKLPYWRRAAVTPLQVSCCWAVLVLGTNSQGKRTWSCPFPCGSWWCAHLGILQLFNSILNFS